MMASASSRVATTRAWCSIGSATASPTSRAPISVLARNAARALACIVAFAASGAFAGGLEELQAFVDGAKTGRATFKQVVAGRNGRPAQEATGTFVFARPGKFRWVYEQ